MLVTGVLLRYLVKQVQADGALPIDDVDGPVAAVQHQRTAAGELCQRRWHLLRWLLAGHRHRVLIAPILVQCDLMHDKTGVIADTEVTIKSNMHLLALLSSIAPAAERQSPSSSQDWVRTFACWSRCDAVAWRGMLFTLPLLTAAEGTMVLAVC